MLKIVKLIKKTYKMAGPHVGRTVMHNVAFLSGLQATTYLLPILILPYLFRIIGPEKFGLIAFAQAFVQYFMILTDYGFSITATKQISISQNHHEKVCKIYSSVMTVKMTLAFLSFMVLSVIIYFVPKFKNDWIVYVLSFGAVVGSTIFPVWFFQGTEKMKYIANLNIAGELVFAFCIFTLVNGPDDYLMVPLINSFVFLATGLIGQYFIFRRFKIRYKFEGYKSFAEQLKVGWNLFISIVAINAYTTTRVFAVGLMTNNTITGYYSIAERIANAVQTFPLSSFTQALFPRLSTIFHKNKSKAFILMQHIQTITFRISLICLPLIFVLAPAIINLVCGKNYPEVVLSLRLLIVSVFFISCNAFRVQFLLVFGKTKTYSKIHIIMALIGLPLIILMISRYSYAGAAMATVFIEGGIFTITYFVIKGLKFSSTSH